MAGIGNTTINLPAGNTLTQQVIDQGLVLVYVNTSGAGSAWYTLPYNGVAQINLVSIQAGSITVNASSNQTGLYFKVVVIPSANPAVLGFKNNPSLFNSYNQVANTLNLKN